MTKHEEYYIEMVEKNQQIFNQFMDLHDKYSNDPNSYQDEFNVEGAKVVSIIRVWERKLCSHSEKGQFGKFSSTLADKFWALVRRDFPKIDFVGVTLN